MATTSTYCQTELVVASPNSQEALTRKKLIPLSKSRALLKFDTKETWGNTCQSTEFYVHYFAKKPSRNIFRKLISFIHLA